MSLLKNIITTVLMFNFFTMGLANSEELKNIAVLDFNNENDLPELDNFKTKLSESLISNLSKYPDLKVADKSKVNSILKELNLNNDGYITPINAVKLGKAMNLKCVVLGSISKSKKFYHVGIRLFDIESSKIFLKKSIAFKNEEEMFKINNYFSLITDYNLGEDIDGKELDDSLKEINIYKRNNTTALSVTLGSLAFLGLIFSLIATGSQRRK